MRPWAALALPLTLAACSPPGVDAPAVFLAVDCAKPFEAQAEALAAQAKLTPAPEDPNEPYRFFSSTDGRTSYLITKPAAPAHPAIMMQKAQGGTVKTTGCAWGDKGEYDKLHAYLDSLKTWTRPGSGAGGKS